MEIKTLKTTIVKSRMLLTLSQDWSRFTFQSCISAIQNAVRIVLYKQIVFKLMTQSLSVKWMHSLDTQPIISDAFDRPSEDNLRTYQKETGKIWQVFEVARNGFIWSIFKSHEEIQDLIIAFNLRFKTSLVFDRFIEEGVHIVSQNREAHTWPPLRTFLELEDSQMGKIGSFVMLKKSGGRFKDYFCCRLPWQWQKRNFVVIKAGIFYYSGSGKEIKQYLPFGKSFRISCGKEETGYELGIKLEASHRKLLLFTSDRRVFCKFFYLVRQTIKQLEGPESNPFESFAPTRQLQHIQFLIDGAKYFQAVFQGLQRAEWQIMISGWWISPQVRLKRPIDQHPQSRLDMVLKKAADKGVKIFILVYNESSFLTNDSAYTKQTLERLSPNIKILQHPLGVLPTFWSHHEKTVIIDQNEVLMGGLDLCYGRFDTTQHLISHNDSKWYPGIQYNNIRTNDFTNVREFWKDNVSRDMARLPWHDVGVHFTGEVVQDVCHHFIEYWNYASFQTHYEKRYLLILEKNRKQPLMKRIKRGINNQIETIKHLADGIKELFTNKKEENVDINPVPSPIQIKSDEIKVQIEQKLTEAQYDSNAKLQIKTKTSANSRSCQSDSSRTYRSNRSNDFKQKMLVYQSDSTQQNCSQNKTKKTMSQLDQIVQKMQDEIQNIDYINEIRITGSVNHMQRLPVISQEEEDGFSCQMLRSVGSWSIGCSPDLKEQSIHAAYVSLIGSAKRYIYIENQFFVSATLNGEVVKNQIANALYSRILRAHYQKTPFKVYILLPLIPGFAGELDDPQAVIPRVIMHWQYHTISRGQNSLLGRLKTANIDPEDFIVFLSLRAHGVLESTQKPATEIIYLHSKLMIVDDLQAIIGSANINDRSMRGNRDSELCLLVQGKPTTKISNISEEIWVNKIIKDLRTQLWRQHFGDDLNYEDPASANCLTSIKKRAKTNTSIYRKVFHCYPDDEIKKLNQLCKSKPYEEQLYEMCAEVKGFVVEFPLQFLKEEDLLVGSTLYPDILSI